MPKRPHLQRIHIQWRERALVLTLLLIGAGLRLWAVGRVPPGLYHDEAHHGLDALAVLQNRAAPLYFAANNGREPLFIYLVTLGVGLLGRSPLAIRLPSFFAGFLTLAATYDLGRVLWGRRMGRWALAVLAATFWHVHLSRAGFRAVLLPLFTALWMAQAVRALSTGRIQNWIAAGALYGASWYTYMAARFTPVALGAIILYGLLTHHRATLRAWRGAQAFCVATLIVLLPLGIYTLSHPDIVLARTGHVSIFNSNVNYGNMWGALLKHTLRTAGMFSVRGDRIWRHNLAWRPIWDPALGLAFVLGLGVTLIRFRRDPRAALVLFWTATLALPTLLAEDAPHFLRAVGVLPTAALIPALGLAWLQDHLMPYVSRLESLRYISGQGPRRARTESRKGRFVHIVANILPAVLVLLGFASTTYDYFARYANAPLTYHWFEAGPVALAGQINALLGSGWDGQRMLHGTQVTPEPGRSGPASSPHTVYMDRRLRESWTAIPFLVPEERVRFLPVTAPLSPNTEAAFVVWPYDAWEEDVLPYIAHPTYLSLTEGPQAQGDLDPEPFTTALIIRSETRPQVPEALARIEGGVVLRAALVRPVSTGAQVRLWWDTEVAPEASYTVYVHYLREGTLIAQHDGEPGKGHLPTTLWEAGDLILDEHGLADVIPDPARDTLRVGFYRSDTGEGLSILDAAGNPAGDWVNLNVILSQ